MPKRLPHNKGLPKGWRLIRGRYYLDVPKDLARFWDGKRMFPLGSTLAEAYLTYGKRLNADGTVAKGKTFADALDRYLLEVSPAKAARTFKNDLAWSGRVRSAFGDALLKPAEITPSACYQYIDLRGAPAQAAKEVKLVSAVLSECVRWGWIERNQLIGQVRSKRAPPKTRLVTDEELAIAAPLAPPWLRAYIVLKVLTGLRQADMLALKVDDGKDDGVHVMPRKTSTKLPTRLRFVWTDALITAWDAALKARPREHELVFCTRDGNPYTSDSFQSTWQRFMTKVVAAGVPRFTEHDLRAKSASDSASLADAQALLGHTDPAVTKRHYRRGVVKVEPLR